MFSKCKKITIKLLPNVFHYGRDHIYIYRMASTTISHIYMVKCWITMKMKSPKWLNTRHNSALVMNPHDQQKSHFCNDWYCFCFCLYATSGGRPIHKFSWPFGHVHHNPHTSTSYHWYFINKLTWNKFCNGRCC